MAANDLLDRYLSAVSRYLPAHPKNALAQRDLIAELAANLHSEMEDKQAALGRPLTKDEQAEVLRRHGHPILVAARYQPQHSLIGPEVFPFYWFTIKRVLPWVIAIWALATATLILFGSPNVPIAQHIHVGHLITGLLGVIFQFLAVVTLIFALIDHFKNHYRHELGHPSWDPRKLPRVEPPQHQGPRHPWADAIASAVFLAWLLAFPSFPVLMFGPYVSWHLINMDLPVIWHQFYWLIVAFTCIQLAARIALLFRPVRRYYHVLESVLHLLGIGIIASLLHTHDYIGEATFGGNSLSPATVATLNANIHSGLIVVLILAIAKFLWDTLQWLRPKAPNAVATKIGAPS